MANIGGGNITCFLKKRLASLTRAAVYVALAASLSAIAHKIETLTYQSYVRDLKLNATIEMVEVRERVERKLINRILALKELAMIVGQNPDISPAAFNIKAVDFVLANTDVKMVAAAPDLIVTMVIPRNGNEQIFGLNYREMPLHLSKILSAMETGDSVMTGPVSLENGSQGLILRMPAFSTDASGNSTPWGILSMVLDYDQFLMNLGIDQLESRFDILIHEAGPKAGQIAEVLLGDSALLASDPILLNLNLPFGTWELGATTDGGWPQHLPNHLTRILNYTIFIAGCLIGLALILRLSDKSNQAERILSVGIEGLEHGFVMFDENRRLIAFNQRYKEIAGRSGMVKIGVKYQDIVQANLRLGLIPDAIGKEEEWYENWTKRLYTQVADNEQILPDGTVIRAYDRLMECGSMVGLRINITDLKSAQRAAEAANRAKTEFMGVLSHELRTPLTIILGHARLAKNMVKLPTYKKLLTEIETHPDASTDILPVLAKMSDQVTAMMCALEQSGDHLYSLISEILDLAKIESGTLVMDFEQTTVSSIVTKVAEQMRPMVESKGLVLEVDIVNCDLNVDANRIRQVLMNLIGNASKFTEQGSIKVSTVTMDDSVVFDVKDSGIGIPDDQIESVFEAFHQIDSTSSRKHNGTGLGLAISRDIARAHKGTLTARSIEGSGSTFTLTLPRFVLLADHIEAGSAQDSAPQPDDAKTLAA